MTTSRMQQAQHATVSSTSTSMKLSIYWLFLVLPTISLGVTTTHYDKPLERKPPTSDTVIEKPQQRLINLTIAERQKRLLPYINFYLTQQINQPYSDEVYQPDQRYRIIVPSKANSYQQLPTKYSELIGTAYQPEKVYEAQQILYQHKAKFTPFLESNALPGPFTPMVRAQPQKIKIAYTPLEQSEKIPNYSTIYDKLSQIKLQQNALQGHIVQQNVNAPQYIISSKPQVFIPVQEYQEEPEFIGDQSPKTYVHAFNPTSIEVANNGETRYESQDYDTREQIPLNSVTPSPELQDEITVAHEPIRLTQISDPKQHIQEQIEIVQEPIRLTPQQNYVPTLVKNPHSHYIVHEQKPYHTQNHKQYLQEVIPNSKPPLILIPQKSFPEIQYAETPKHQHLKVPKPIIIIHPTSPQAKPYIMEPIVTQTYQPVPTVQLVTPAPDIQTENPNSLSLILKKLQDSNALPQTLTPDNIDNSIKTLVHILSSLKKQQKLTAQPIVVADEGTSYEEEEQENEAGVGLGDSHAEPPPGTIVQAFPAHTPEGGTPGKPGIDYPALSSIPKTNFNCKTQRYKGFFADPDTHCQVWHYCDLNGGQASFLCPNGTIFSQVALTCDWWFNVKCSTTTQLYVLNERLYKYIIPLTPKFPEDYTGPLVDRYLALKFKEMEEKMKSEKKKKKPEDDKSDEVDELQLLEGKNTKHSTTPPAEEK